SPRLSLAPRRLLEFEARARGPSPRRGGRVVVCCYLRNGVFSRLIVSASGPYRSAAAAGTPAVARSRGLRGAAKLACRPDACSGPPFKKMKKRKELDALVSCRSTAPRAVLTSSQQQHAVQELLRKGAVAAAAGSHGGGHGSDSSDDVETSSYAALAAYRLPASPPVRWWAWLPVGLVLLVGAAGALVWLHLTLRQDLDSLRAHLHR
ncbi:hypothetical protein MTO96_046894, partial [Rhipicephalus appendiculatus]